MAIGVDAIGFVRYDASRPVGGCCEGGERGAVVEADDDVVAVDAVVDRPRPWVAGAMGHALRIQPDIVTGFRLDVQPPAAVPAR